MRLFSNTFIRTLSTLLLFGGLVSACAQGAPDGDPDTGTVDTGTGDGGVDGGGPDNGPITGLCQECVVDDQCPEGAECVPFGDASLCLERVADEFATCPRTFEAAQLATRPNRYYCLPTEGCCIDEDDDNYGEGAFCDGPDCNDDDALVNPMADELCNGDDDDCDTLTDNAPIDCQQQGCDFNGANYEQSPGADCVTGTCEQVTVTTCGLYSCVGGLSVGDVCAGSCMVEGVENDEYCVPSAHCEPGGVCALDYDNGESCDTDTDCASSHCENGFCCADGACCSQNSDCPGFPGTGVTCDDTPSCQGTIGAVTCNLGENRCETVNGAANDSGCTTSVEANTCGAYPSVFCAGGTNQSTPVCATSCLDDSQCDANAHCDNNLCVLDLPDGNACDEGSDCSSAHCQNDFCCSGGDCCAMANDCPGSYRSASVCIDDATCQGTRSDAVCTGNVCGTQAGIQDDTGCGTMTEADTCASFPSVFCNGMTSQTRPPCQGACTLDSQCDTGSHCDGVCIPDITDGGVCDEPSDCATGHCQNGRCCTGGDCCATAANCPASYSENSTCGDTTTCQGTRSDATCVLSVCGTQAGVPDDSGCTVSAISSNCGAYPSATCAGTADQSAPVCPASCANDSNCDANAHCDGGVCVLDVPNGDMCDEDSDCVAGHCQNGFCCATGDCCSTATNCPASYTTANACTSPTTCQGTRADATCTNNQCGSTASIGDDRACNGVMALDCGAFPDRYCDGQENQTPPVCAAACTADGDCVASAHCDAVCVPDQGNGTSCDEDSDCTGNHCQNGFCCASGDCCSTAANCPSTYSTASTCTTAATCQGTRSDATCNAAFQCGTQTNVPDDSGCGMLTVANTCGFFPSVTCIGVADQVPPTCSTGCISDADCDANAHCDGGACLPDLTDGNSCDEASDCIANHCQNDRCCSGGDCCQTASNCPSSYSSPSVCADPATCQGTRSDAVCSGNVCGTTTGVADDSACNAGVQASTCGPYPSTFCNGLANQVVPACGTSCSTNSNCDVDAHCSGGLCVPDLPNGGNCALTGAAACTSGLCNNGFCCTSGTCCATATDCPAAFGSPSACNSVSTCQGTRSDRTCVSNTCGTAANIPDDTACSAATVANTCGVYPSVSCNGAADQMAPACGMSCSADGDCDSNAHCDTGVCLPDLTDGSTCDEDSDCVASHCQNNRCCVGGDCCSAASQCPASYTTAPSCVSPAVCDGRRFDATCNSFVCGTSAEIDDDSACMVSTLANACSTYADVFCNGQVTQSAPMCGSTCSTNAQCDSSANCQGGLCVSDGANGDACSADNQCMSNHCQNGFCCATGDCCSIASNCPASYSNAATCDTPSSCQGTRDDAVCGVNKQCSTTTNVQDDSACTMSTLANACGLFADITCSGATSQTGPTCPGSCSSSAQCDSGAFCNSMGVCQTLRTQGQTCSLAADCAGGLACTDGVCCNSTCSGSCQACNLAGSLGTCTNVPNGQDPASECGAISCTGWYSGWGGINADQCFTAQDAVAGAVDCNGSGSCETAAQVCPSQPANMIVGDCNDLCQAKNLSTCSGMVAPACTSVTPTPTNQNCNSGVCAQSVARCLNGVPQSCPNPTSHPMYGPEICDGLDNNCNTTVDDGGAALCTLPNSVEACMGAGGCVVSSCEGSYLNPNMSNPDGCECLPESNSANACATAAAGAPLHTLSEGMNAMISGNLDTTVDGDWYRVQMTNSAAEAFRINVAFASGNTDIVFDLYQSDCSTFAQYTGQAGFPAARSGSACGGTSSQPRNIRSYSYDPLEANSQCVPNDNGGTDCNSAATRAMYIHVHRAAGVAPTCSPYTLTFTNG